MSVKQASTVLTAELTITVAVLDAQLAAHRPGLGGCSFGSRCSLCRSFGPLAGDSRSLAARLQPPTL